MSDLTMNVLQNRVWSVVSNGFFDTRILVVDWVSTVIVTLLAVWIGFWAPRYWKLLMKFLSWTFRWDANDLNQARPIVARNEDDRNEIPLPEANHPKAHRILNRAHAAEDAAVRLGQLINTLGLVTTLPALFLAITVYLAIAGAGVAVSFLVLDSIAVSSSEDCAVLVPDGSNITANPMGAIMNPVESYYISCHENDPSSRECGIFADEDLHINYTEGVECPFAGDMCLLGRNSAISLDTGYRDSKDIDINSQHRPFFRRRSVCAPLVFDGYYTEEFDNATSSTKIKFNYGPSANQQDNSTFSHLRSPLYESHFSPSGYEIKTRSTTLRQFDPIDALKSTMGEVFIAFVVTFNLQYPTTSTDPIFSALNSSTCSYSNQTCWKNSLQRASVLGCAELAEVCTPNMDKCYNVWDPAAAAALSSMDWNGAEEAFFISHGLNYSDFGNVLLSKHAFILDATRRIVGNKISQSLDAEQWKLEVRRLFSMSLLRAKWEMLYAVRGTRANEPGYVNILPSKYRGVCEKFKFQARGYKNISFIGLLVVIFLPFLIGLDYEGQALMVWPILGAVKLVRFVSRSLLGKAASIMAMSSQQLTNLGVRQWLGRATQLVPGLFKIRRR